MIIWSVRERQIKIRCCGGEVRCTFCKEMKFNFRKGKIQSEEAGRRGASGQFCDIIVLFVGTLYIWQSP